MDAIVRTVEEGSSGSLISGATLSYTLIPAFFGPIYIGDGAIVKAGRIVTKDVGPGEKM